MDRPQDIRTTTAVGLAPQIATITQAVAAYIESCALGDLSPHTLTSYRLHTMAWARWLEAHGITRPDEVSPVLAQSYLTEYKSKHAPRSMALHVTVLRAFEAWCADFGLISWKSIAAVKHARSKARPDNLPPTELATVDALLAEADKEARDMISPLRVALLVLCDTGCRISELTALQVGDVDLKARRLTFRPEHAKRQRPCMGYITAPTAESLDAFLLMPRDLKGRALDERLLGLDDDSLRRHLHRLAARAGLKGAVYNPHSFRRMFLSHMLREGVGLEIRETIVGHSLAPLIGQVAFVYTSIDPTQCRAAVDAHSPVRSLKAAPLSEAYRSRIFLRAQRVVAALSVRGMADKATADARVLRATARDLAKDTPPKPRRKSKPRR